MESNEPHESASGRHSSSQLFYVVAATLGLAFSAVVAVLAWNNVLQNETRNFAFDAVSAQNGVESNVRTAEAIVNDLAAFVDAGGERSKLEFVSYVERPLGQYDFVIGLAHATINRAGDVAAINVHGDASLDLLRDMLSHDYHPHALVRDLHSADGVLPLVKGDAGGPGVMFMLRVVGEATAGAAGESPVVIMALDLARLVKADAVDPGLRFALYTESQGVAGRRLIYEKPSRTAFPGSEVEALSQENVIRLAGFSMRYKADKVVTWQELDKGLVFAALFLGFGVTLLLVALARAKDLQARELAARNRVIEEQVRQQTRELAEARDAALEASRVKSDFLASMSHEIRTPLNAIIGMADLLSETQLDVEQEKYVGVFRNAGEALLSLVNDILDLSKIEAEQLTLESIDFDLVDIIEQAVEIYSLKADDRGIDLVTAVAGDVPQHLVGDPGRLRQIVLNLVGNALKFTERGHISVRVRMAEARDRVLRLHFEVADTGIGIPADKLETIFSDFTQVDSSVTRKYGGTGLGLAICKRLVELMHGRIWVESTVDVGSSFRFEVELAPSPTQSTLPRLPAGQVLLVEPNADLRCALAEVCAAAGAEVTELDGGEGIVAAAGDGATPQLIVIGDGAAGEGVAEQVRMVREQFGNIPVVGIYRPAALTTGVEALRDVPHTALVVKPVRRAKLFEAAQQAAGNAAAAVADEAVDTAVASAHEAAVLLVDDNPDNRLLVQAYLKQEPYAIVEAENGAEGVEAFRSGNFELVLMDVQMPVMDGYAATRAIREIEAQEQRRRVPVIALTASAVSEDVEKSLAAGCDQHLTKPIKKQTLIDMLADTLAAARQASAG